MSIWPTWGHMLIEARRRHVLQIRTKDFKEIRRMHTWAKRSIRAQKTEMLPIKTIMDLTTMLMSMKYRSLPLANWDRRLRARIGMLCRIRVLQAINMLQHLCLRACKELRLKMGRKRNMMKMIRILKIIEKSLANPRIDNMIKASIKKGNF